MKGLEARGDQSFPDLLFLGSVAPDGGVANLEIAAIVIALVSLVWSMWMGWHNRKTARRALTLSELQEARRTVRFDMELKQSISWKPSDEGVTVLGFHVLLANASDRSTAVVSADMHLTYGIDGQLVTVKVPHADAAGSAIDATGVEPLVLPVPIDSSSATQGWLLFCVADGLTGGATVERYEISLGDVHGMTASRQVSVIIGSQHD